MGSYDPDFGMELRESPDAPRMRTEKHPAYPFWHLLEADIEWHCVTSVEYPSCIRLNGYPAMTWCMPH